MHSFLATEMPRRRVIVGLSAVALILPLACAPRLATPAPFRCPVHRVDVTSWQQVGVRDAPVELRVPVGTRRYLGLNSAFYPTGWKFPAASPDDSADHETVLLADVRPDTTVDRRDATDAIAQWFAPDPASACDAFVVRVGAQRMRVTLFESRDTTAPSFRNGFAAPYAVDAIMPLIASGSERSWLVLAGRSWSRTGQERLVSTLATARSDDALAEASHPTLPCPAAASVSAAGTWIWHTFRTVRFRILQPADMKWGDNFKGVESWVRPATDTERVPPNAYQLSLVATPEWQLAGPELPPAYYMTCRTEVAGLRTDVLLDTLGSAADLGPEHVRAYKAYAYVGLGRDSVMRVRAEIYDDVAPPSQFLRLLSRIEAASNAP
jgi:hypothetical protein